MPESTTPHHLLNTSWTLHRLSPLHHGKEFQTVVDNPTALSTYAARLRDQLTGDVLAGLQQPAPVPAGEDDDGLSKIGALKTCTWEGIGMSLLTNEDDNDNDNDDNEEEGKGVLIVLDYENATYKVVLLPGLKPAPGNTTTPTTTTTQPTDRQGGSTHLPLLMTRLPTSLRQTVISFLSGSFDTYCTALRLPMSFMCVGLETYVDAFLDSEYGDGSDALQSVVKDMHLTLSFSRSIAPALKALNITVPRTSVDEFLRSSPGTGSSASSKAFLANISRYIEKHLSLKLDLSASSPTGSAAAQTPAKQHVRLSKIACGGFVLGAEGRIKLVGRTGGSSRDRVRDDEDSRMQNEREKLEVRGSEALLRVVMQRVGGGGNQMRES